MKRSRRVIERLKSLKVKKAYTTDEVKPLLDENIDHGILICRLFLGLSKDQFVSTFKGIREDRGIGVKSYHAQTDAEARARRRGLCRSDCRQGVREEVSSALFVRRPART